MLDKNFSVEEKHLVYNKNLLILVFVLVIMVLLGGALIFWRWQQSPVQKNATDEQNVPSLNIDDTNTTDNDSNKSKSTRDVVADTPKINSLTTADANSSLGEDKDNDGVWDDIQSWIEKNYSDRVDVAKLLRYFAKTLQRRIIGSQDKTVVQETADSISKISECLVSKYGQEGSDMISKLSTNFSTFSRARATKMLEADTKFSQVFYPLSDDEISDFCDSVLK